jgi:hypothetical protein
MDCDCVSYFSNIQNELNSLFNSIISLRSNSNLPSTDSELINNRFEIPNHRNYFTLNNVLYFIMSFLAMLSLISIGINKFKKEKSCLK